MTRLLYHASAGPFGMPADRARRGGSPVERCETRAVVGDEHGEQARGLGGAGVLADEMLAARRLEEALAGLVHFGGPPVAEISRADRAGEHIGEDAARVAVLGRLPAQRVVDHHGGDALAGDVRQLLRDHRLHLGAGVQSGRPVRGYRSTSRSPPARERPPECCGNSGMNRSSHPPACVMVRFAAHNPLAQPRRVMNWSCVIPGLRVNQRDALDHQSCPSSGEAREITSRSSASMAP